MFSNPFGQIDILKESLDNLEEYIISRFKELDGLQKKIEILESTVYNSTCRQCGVLIPNLKNFKTVDIIKRKDGKVIDADIIFYCKHCAPAYNRISEDDGITKYQKSVNGEFYQCINVNENGEEI